MDERILSHPILTPPRRRRVRFTFDGTELEGYEGEPISSALFANGIRVFNTHEKDGAPQGIFCANGQCAQCLVLVDRRPVKACITPLSEWMDVRSIQGLPALAADDAPAAFGEVRDEEVEVLIIGGGPSGLSAAIELGRKGVDVLVVDDKLELGGKLGLQTHNFFGSIKDCYAGTRGMDIGTIMSRQVEGLRSVRFWLESPAVGVFADGKVGVVRDGVFRLVTPRRLLVTTGAREGSLAFPGCDLPGVYGAGAFQTLVNRDMVKASSRLFIVGGGNVGLIGAYHALQAGIEVVGLVEALPHCGGYKVHLDKILRLGIPVFTSHTILKAEGDGHLERVTTCAIDGSFQPIAGTEREYEVDTLLIAVGLIPVDELLVKARQFGIGTYSAGDADTIAEASAAIFSGKIEGRRILRDMGRAVDIPPQWDEMVALLRHKTEPGAPATLGPLPSHGVYPVIRCTQNIPCNPCTEACPLGSITIPGETMSYPPRFGEKCIGCGRCVSICPGLAITLVDRRYDPTGASAVVTVAWELPEGELEPGMVLTTTGWEGEPVGHGRVLAVKRAEWQNRRTLVNLEVPGGQADSVAGILYRTPEGRPALPFSDTQSAVGRATAERSSPPSPASGPIDDKDIIVCRCERVDKAEIKRKIMDGCRDINALKAELRVGMGPCGGKTCMPLIARVFRECGVDPKEVEPHVERPFVQEVPLSSFLGEVDE